MSESNTPSTGGGGIPLPKSKRGLKGFIAEVGREMKKVNWPSRPDTNRLTGVVLAVCGLVVVILSAMSVVFDTLVRILTKGSA